MMSMRFLTAARFRHQIGKSLAKAVVERVRGSTYPCRLVLQFSFPADSK